jgi:guanosine-3',5'-bis(diphosphate) 3'-pyrophosphohydrolase
MTTTLGHSLKNSKKVRIAMQFAKQRHGYQLRKDKRTLYWVHLEQVVNNLLLLGIKDIDILCAGWLHDTIEDTSTDFDDIYEKFGLKVAEMVAQVTKDKRLPKKEREKKYIKSLSKAPWPVQTIKLCDIMANLSDLPNLPESRAKKEEQVSNKLQYLMAIKNGLLNNKNKIPNLKVAIDIINSIVVDYNKPIIKL